MEHMLFSGEPSAIYGERRETIEIREYEVGDYTSRGASLHYPNQLQIPVSLLLGSKDDEPKPGVIYFDLQKWIRDVKDICVVGEGR